jgi:hypothetical protein
MQGEYIRYRCYKLAPWHGAGGALTHEALQGLAGRPCFSTWWDAEIAISRHPDSGMSTALVSIGTLGLSAVVTDTRHVSVARCANIETHTNA